jgi:putative membrane protein insertion efficiency factor
MGARFLLLMIRFYRRGVSPLLPAACRYTPTCSAYAEQAIERYGAVRGSWLGARRLLRCHPWGGSGYDPVPELPRGKSAGTN